MIIIYILMALAISLSIVTVIIQTKGIIEIKFLIKSIASFCFLAMGIVAVWLADNLEIWHIAIVVALLCGLMGDIFLATDGLVKKEYLEPLLLVGLLFFLIGHVIYIIVYFSIADSFNLLFLIIVGIFPLIMFGIIKTKFMEPKKAILPIIIYSAIIGLMVATATNLFVGSSFSKQSTLIFIGALLFTCSDLLLAFYNFGNRKKCNILAYIYMPAYYIAQTLFVLAMLF